MDDPKTKRAFRNVRCVVGNRLTREMVYSPPPQKEVVPQMNAHVGWLNSGAAHKIHPVSVAGIAHYELVRVHPFCAW